MKIFLATENKGKIKEIMHVMSDVEIELVSVSLDLDEPQTDDMEAISKGKVMQAFEQLNGPVLVDDSGVYFKKYKNFPGVYARPVIEGLGLKGIKRLFDEGDGGIFETVLSYMDKDLDEPEVFTGSLHGYLSHKDSNLDIEVGFPYNHIVIPEGFDKFMYQLSMQERVGVNQRTKAAQRFKKWIQNNRM